MRFKKGFTLAEILIVLMIIGGLAMLTIPSLMKGITEAQFKTAYKKGLNTIVNLAAMERASGGLPGIGSAANADILFDRLVSSLSVKSFLADNDTTPGTGGVALNRGVAVTDNSLYLTTVPDAENRHTNWIVTDDNLAYLIHPVGNGACSTKFDIAAGQGDKYDSVDSLEEKACFVIWIDVNGLSAGPNTAVGGSGAQGIDSSAKTSAISDDQFPIYVGVDGATAGNNLTTITGRIAADVK